LSEDSEDETGDIGVVKSWTIWELEHKDGETGAPDAVGAENSPGEGTRHAPRMTKRYRVDYLGSVSDMAISVEHRLLVVAEPL
jgi:hypothetical protein